MVRYNLKTYITVLVTLSIFGIFAVAFIRNGCTLNEFAISYKDVTATITFVFFISTLFVSWMWKLKMFKGWLVPFPCLSGKWIGEIKTVYDGKKMTIPTEAVIHHNFFNIQIQIRTGESSSVSSCGGFDIDKDRGLNHLIYSYQNEPDATIRERSEIHFGTTRVKILENATKLKGEYWTSRKTIGSITLNKCSNVNTSIDLSQRAIRKNRTSSIRYLK